MAKAGLYGLFLKFGGAALIMIIIAVLASFLVTVTHEDAVYYLERKSAIKLTNPKPGALYAVNERRILGSYLCELEVENDDVVRAESPRRYAFYNQAGILLPALTELNTGLVAEDKNLQDLSADGAFHRRWYVREDVLTGSGRAIKKNCEKEVLQAIDNGKKVCRVDAVMIRHGDGAPYAVKFNNHCIVKCPEEKTGCSQREEFPQLDDVAWTTRLKHELDLISGGPA